MMSDWTILNKKHASVCYSIAQVAQLGMLVFFSLYTTRPDQIMSAAGRQSWEMVLNTLQKIMVCLSKCLARRA